MLRKTLIFETPAYLSYKNGLLVYSSKTKDEVKSVSLEDIGVVIFDNPRITISTTLIAELTSENCAVIFCDNKHHPTGMSVSFNKNNTHAKVLSKQIEMSASLKKRLWQQTVEFKIKNQAGLLQKLNLRGFNRLLKIAKDVKSGDSTGRESVAARVYWKCLLGGDFKRSRFGAYPNNYLNYAYTLLRAAVARSLVGSGLYPAIGIHHHSQYDAYALADDIMEPYRAYADELVIEIINDTKHNTDELNKDIKHKLANLFVIDVNLTKTLRPLMVALSYTSASFVRCITKEQKKIDYPLYKIK